MRSKSKSNFHRAIFRRKAGARDDHPGGPTESTSQLGTTMRSDLPPSAAQVAGLRGRGAWKTIGKP